MFRVVWEGKGESETKAKVYDVPDEAAEWEDVGTVTARWQRPTIPVGPNIVKDVFRVFGQLNVMESYSDLAALVLDLRIEGRKLKARSQRLAKTATEVTLDGTWGDRKVEVRIRLDAIPTADEITRQPPR